MSPKDQPPVLTIATSDSGGGAGVQADLLTFSDCEAFGVTAFAALTAQNPDSVSAIHELPPEFLESQLEQIIEFFPVRVAKTGMLFSAPLIRTAATFIARHGITAVVDPVMVATSGARLLKEDAVEALVTELLPQAAIITPNLDEAAVLLGKRPTTTDEMTAAAQELAQRFQTAVLLKGGHLTGDELVDCLVTADGTVETIVSRRIPDVDTHGSGCTLSAAIAAYLARGESMPSAVRAAHAYLRRGLENPVRVAGRNFIAH